MTETGTLSFTDVDVNDTHTVTEAQNLAPVWSNGSLSLAQAAALDAGFSVTNAGWTYSIPNALVQFLREGETITLSYVVTVTDNSGQLSNNSDSEVVMYLLESAGVATVALAAWGLRRTARRTARRAACR